jgi:ribosomal protein S18 acetylase RimI-like enzyme
VSVGFRIRKAFPHEAPALTELAMRSKQSWGYDDAFMQRIADDMVVQPEFIEREHAIVAQDGEIIAGYAIVRVDLEQGFLRDLFVDPPYMHRGIGELLLQEALSFARSNGAKRFSLVSDPNAVGFYKRQGMRVIALEPSCYVPGRSLPVMVMNLE